MPETPVETDAKTAALYAAIATSPIVTLLDELIPNTLPGLTVKVLYHSPDLLMQFNVIKQIFFCKFE